MRISQISDNLLDCNYMMFQNAQFGNGKWFYAFITSVEYVNNETSQITYVLDEFQTWQFNALGRRGIVLGNCFVEREHVNDDTIGLHTVAENLELGEYIMADGESKKFETAIGLYCVPYDEIDRKTMPLESDLINGLPTPLSMEGYYSDDGADLEFFDEIINKYRDKPELVAMLCAVPKECILNGKLNPTGGNHTVNRPRPFHYTINGVVKDHTVRNNKLYTYPYCFFTADNYNGQSEVYRWEDFSVNGKAMFTYRTIINPRPCIEVYPLSYKGLTANQAYGLVYDDFPSLPFNVDTYKQWISQVVPKALIGVGASVATTAIGVATGNAVLGATGALATINAINQGKYDTDFQSRQLQANVANRMSNRGVGGSSLVNTASSLGQLAVDTEYHKIHGACIGGTIASSGANFNENRVGFRFNCFSIRPEYADIIDLFFTKYGYRVNKVKVPNLTGREYFNFVKTRECIVLGDIPSDSRIIIEECFNNGITLWHTTDVGNINYNLGNPIVTE